MALVQGTRIGDYEIVSPIGRGGMGEVYRARDCRLGRTVALKVLRSDIVSDDDRKMRLLREARIVSALDHPNIVSLYDIVTFEGGTVLIMQLVEGRSLAEVIGNSALPTSQIFPICEQISAALAAAHSAGVIHRDLKPENILVTDEGKVKLLDFGIAKSFEVRKVPSIATTQTLADSTGDQVIVGTPAYMSPEQVLGNPVSPRSDVFSFGVVAYEMVTGRKAFQGSTNASIMAAVLRDEPTLEVSRNAIPPALKAVLSKCLVKDPEGRYSGGNELHSAIAAAANASTTVVKARPGIAIAVGLLLIASLFAGLIYLKKPQSQPGTQSPLKASPLTALRGSEGTPAFSPDGESFAFAWDGGNGGTADLYKREVRGGPISRLTVKGGTGPAWSPDAQQIAFIRYADGKAKVMTIGANGGDEREVAPHPGGPFPKVAWTLDGQHLVFAQSMANGPTRLVSFNLSSGAINPITMPPVGALGDSQPSFSKDGQLMSFVRYAELGTSHLYVGKVVGSPPRLSQEPRRLTEQGRNIQGVAWSGGDVILSSSGGGGTSLWRVPTNGGASQRIEGIEGALSPAISQSKARLAFMVSRDIVAIYRRPGPDGDPSGKTERWIEGGSGFSPRYSPDGSKIAFFSTRSGSFEIWVADKDGNNPVQLTNFGGPLTGLPQWSPDSRNLVFDTRPNGNSDVYWIPATDGTPLPLISENSEDVTPWWSRDGGFVYYASNRSGRFEIWKTPAPDAKGKGGGAPTQVTSNGGYSPIQSTDGKSLFYARSRTEPGLFRLNLKSGEESKLVENAGAGMYGQWDVRPDALYFVPFSSTASSQIYLYQLSTQKTVQFADMGSPALGGLPAFSISPDGKSILFCRRERFGSDLMLVENFR